MSSSKKSRLTEFANMSLNTADYSRHRRAAPATSSDEKNEEKTPEKAAEVEDSSKVTTSQGSGNPQDSPTEDLSKIESSTYHMLRYY
ncbi:hypothetical protein VFPPC_13227 [Pochonia chlamydosporia 170]|uniref:Uncharacterized protein n=1 Tax=Pochonia chlamydosporia 170 TaxID=1380566 RepID=A0A179F738_METCM|nr:hypothetical protein VFPPC_13227 [Pochonia chlamydosporia 170]OAQ61217.1 hypothetical protein VFPPC_13227 [Pochonia chlamydosporia 170]